MEDFSSTGFLFNEIAAVSVSALVITAVVLNAIWPKLDSYIFFFASGVFAGFLAILDYPMNLVHPLDVRLTDLFGHAASITMWIVLLSGPYAFGLGCYGLIKAFRKL
jgi:hypothetical protein